MSLKVKKLLVVNVTLVRRLREYEKCYTMITLNGVTLVLR